MQLPARLREAIEAEAGRREMRALAPAAERLSSRYRQPGESGGGLVTSDVERAAYAVVRMPATYAALRAVLTETKARLAGARITSVLDLGAGPGTTAWAAADVLTDVTAVTLVERDEGMIALGRRLAGDDARLNWVRGEVSTGPEPGPHDLVVASYVMGELEAKARTDALHKAWKATRVALVLVEPGTVPGFERIRSLRSGLVGAGAHVIAPCPHSGDCPMSPGDWCHFPERVERTPLHRILKAGTLGYEDEKYSYVVATREPAEPATARIIRHPERRPGLAKLALCGREGLETATVTRSERELWRKARKAAWGDGWG